MEQVIRTKILALSDRHRNMALATLRPDGWPQATRVMRTMVLRSIFSAALIARRQRIARATTACR
jgi:hypothetical protein